MNKFGIDVLYNLVKRSVDVADLESLLTAAPADDYVFEAREIAEHLAEGDNDATVEDFTTWLSTYWARQFGAIATEEWLASRDFRGLAEELVNHRKKVDTSEASLRYQSWLHSLAFGCAETNGQLLDRVKLGTVKLAEQLYGRWATGVQHDVNDAERRLRQIAGSAGYGETRRVMVQELLPLCMKVDARGFLACFRGESKRTGSGKPAEEIEADTLQVQLHDCVSLYVESVLAQPAQGTGCGSEDFDSATGNNSFN